jgi:CBS domain-containing protein
VVVDLLVLNNIHHLLVVDQDSLVGVISNLDVQKYSKMMAHNGLQLSMILDSDIRAADIMTSPVISCIANMKIKDASSLMVKYGIKCLPVVQDVENTEESGGLIGLITSHDLCS